MIFLTKSHRLTFDPIKQHYTNTAIPPAIGHFQKRSTLIGWGWRPAGCDWSGPRHGERPWWRVESGAAAASYADPPSRPSGAGSCSKIFLCCFKYFYVERLCYSCVGRWRDPATWPQLVRQRKCWRSDLEPVAGLLQCYRCYSFQSLPNPRTDVYITNLQWTYNVFKIQVWNGIKR